MINKIQIIIDVIGVVFCAVSAVLTGEVGFLIATIWAIIALISHIND